MALLELREVASACEQAAARAIDGQVQEAVQGLLVQAGAGAEGWLGKAVLVPAGMSAMVKCSPAIQARRERCSSSRAISGSVAATDWVMVVGLRWSAGVRTHCTNAPPLARLRVVCCQSIQRSASKRWGRSAGYSGLLAP